MTAPGVTPTDAAERIAAGDFLLDVRQPYEWAEAHIEGATLIPLDELRDRLADVPRRPIVVVCRSGARSGVAADALSGAGYDAVNLDGGMIAWMAAGLPTASE